MQTLFPDLLSFVLDEPAINLGSTSFTSIPLIWEENSA